MNDTELPKAYEPTQVERRCYEQWLQAGYFHAEPRSDKPAFSMVLPPPNVTGSLHIGHALTATIQDILVRWKRMSGFNTLWLPGTDHAGIATQMVVEKELKKTEGKSRHDLGREAFLERVWAWKGRYGARIGEQHQYLGASLDWSRERFTMDEGSSAAVREAFVRLHEEGLIYRAAKLINWCPSCRTALSDLEVEHEEKQGSLWHIRYPVKGSERFLTVATTRPETMLGDTAVAVHPDDERYKDLIGHTVVLPLVEREIPVIADAELVDPAFGSGVVKVTPGHDFNDYQTGLRHKLPMVSILDDAGRTNKEAGAYAGLDRMDARSRVLLDLAERGNLEREEPHKLSVGGCQRCGTVVEPRLSPQWFVKIEPLARPAIEAVEQGRTRFVPATWTNTYFQWMRNIHDWTISRQLWWGHQIPAYYCKSCSPRQGDDTDLALDAATVRVGGIDYGRATPLVARERPEACPSCGGHDFEQDPDVLDTWFSSGLWPLSTLGWPRQTEELKTFYPTSVMETGHDIIFFWVARMMMFGLHFMKDVPFRTVYLHAMVRDEKGEKMSKTKGNVIDPLDVINGAPAAQLAPSLRNKFPQGMPAFGADALRFTLAAQTQAGRDIKLSLDRVGGYKAFANKLWNASRFALMNMGDFRLGAGHVKDLPLSVADRWILARLNRATRDTQAALEAFQFAEAASTLYQFLWNELCDWYIELSKSTLYGEDAAQKDVTRSVLVVALDRVLRLLHPFMPFVTEEIWQKLPMERPTPSIMIAPYPTPEPRLEDAAAEEEMAPVIAAIEGLRSIRGESNVAPSARIVALAQSPSARVRELLERHQRYVMPLAGLSELRVGAPGPRPAQAAAWVGPELEILVPLAGLIDLDAERERIRKEISRTETELAGLRRKLDNPNFVAKAPPDVVEKDQARVQELEARKAKLQDNLNRIAPEQTMSTETRPEAAGTENQPETPETAEVMAPPPAEGGKGEPSQKGEAAEAAAPEAGERRAPEREDVLTREGAEAVPEGESAASERPMPAARKARAARKATAKKGAAKKGGAKKAAAKKGAARPAARSTGARKALTGQGKAKSKTAARKAVKTKGGPGGKKLRAAPGKAAPKASSGKAKVAARGTAATRRGPAKKTLRAAKKSALQAKRGGKQQRAAKKARR